MKPILSPWTSVALSTMAAAWLLAVPTSAQDRPGGGGGGGGAASHGGGAASGGGSTASSGGAASSGGSSSGGGSSAPATSGGGSSGGGGGSHAGYSGGHGESRGGATGGSGYAAPRGGGSERGGSVARTNGGGGSGATSSGTGGSQGGVSSAPSGDRGRAVARGSDHATKGDSGGSGVPAYARPRDGQPVVGTAVPRGAVPVPVSGGVIVAPGYYGGFYDPFWYGAGVYGAYGGYYGGGYGASYGGFYDPWYGGDPASGGSSDPQSSYNAYTDEGSIRLKIRPRNSEVYVDGYFVGVVDDFDGVFQRLHIESGAHRIEVRAPGYEPLAFDVRITPDHKTTYEGELKRIP
jgi:hypothetical protein